MKTIKTIVELIFVFLLVLVIFYYSGINNVEFHGDESQWIATSVVFETFLSGDFQSAMWTESHWMLTQPHLPRYVIGVGRWICGIDTSELNPPYDWSVDYETNKERGNLPSDRLLNCSRFPMEVLSAISICTVYFLLKKMGGYFPALVWVFLIMHSDYFPLMLGRAMGESTLLASISFLMIISSYFLEVAGNSFNPIRFYLYMFIFGIGVGFAGSSKLNGFSLLAVGVLFSILMAYRLKDSTKNKIYFVIISNIILIFSSLLVWITINPFLWPDPFSRTIEMFNYRVMEMSNQYELFPQSRISGILPRIKVLTKRIFQSYSSIRFIGSWILNLFFFCLGLISLSINSIRQIKSTKSNYIWIIFLLIGSLSSLPVLITPLDWDRYYLFPIYFSTISIVVGIWKFFTFLKTSNKLSLRTNHEKYL